MDDANQWQAIQKLLPLTAQDRALFKKLSAVLLTERIQLILQADARSVLKLALHTRLFLQKTSQPWKQYSRGLDVYRLCQQDCLRDHWYSVLLAVDKETLPQYNQFACLMGIWFVWQAAAVNKSNNNIMSQMELTLLVNAAKLHSLAGEKKLTPHFVQPLPPQSFRNPFPRS